MQLPYSDELNIGYLSRLFDNTTNCYKFFWFQAILSRLDETHTKLSFEELLNEMTCSSEPGSCLEKKRRLRARVRCGRFRIYIMISEMLDMKDFTNKHINANQIHGMQTITGKLYFYEDGLAYKADSVNGSINQGKILYSDILKINKRNTLGIVPNGFSIILKDNTEYIYVVNSRNAVVEYITTKIEE